MSDDLIVSLRLVCRRCGSSDINVPERPSADDAIFCRCGTDLGTYEQASAKIRQVAIASVSREFAKGIRHGMKETGIGRVGIRVV
jgi:hypothetical protein